ncbi:MAG: hypothetical protein ABL983_19225, partial [Nitrospira sp.]
WSLTGPRGVEVNNRQFNQDTNQPILNLVPGSYTLTVDASGNTTGGYSFRLHNLATGTSVTPGTVVNGTLSPGNRTEIHKLAVNAGDRFTFDAQTSSGGSLSWRLINPYGRQVFGPGNFTDVANQTLNTPGQYTLVIEGNAANTANVSYNFNVQFLGNTPPPPVVGTPLTFDTTTSGTISTPNAVVRYTFNVPTQRVLYLDTLTNNSNIFWTLRGPAGDEMANLNSFVAQDVRLLVAGDYVLEVTSPFANSFSFRLDDLNTAPVLTLGTPVSNAQLSPPNRTDAYRFSALAGDKFYFDTQNGGASPGSISWRLVGSHGQIVWVSDFSQDMEPPPLLTTGTYTLLIEGSNFNSTVGFIFYGFAVNQIDASQQALTVGATTRGTILTANEEDRFTFTIVEPTLVSFDALTNNANFRWSLAGPSGDLVVNRSFTASDSAALTTNPVL